MKTKDMRQENIAIIGASDNEARTSYAAFKLLLRKGFNVIPIGNKKGKIDGIAIHDFTEKIENVDAVTIFLQPKRQKKYYDYILGLHPKKIIFNPGSENPELEFLATQHQIQIIKGCTIALLMNGFFKASF